MLIIYFAVVTAVSVRGLGHRSDDLGRLPRLGGVGAQKTGMPIWSGSPIDGAHVPRAV